MRYLVAIAVLFSTQAAFSFPFYAAKNMTTDQGCEFKNPFVEVQSEVIYQSYSWSGACIGGQVSGFGWIRSNDSNNRYFAQFKDGKLVGDVYYNRGTGRSAFERLKKTGIVFRYSNSQDVDCKATPADCAPLLAELRKMKWGSEVKTDKGCTLHDDLPHMIRRIGAETWSGECKNGKANGYGWLSYKEDWKNGPKEKHQFRKYKDGQPANKYAFIIDQSFYTEDKGSVQEIGEFGTTSPTAGGSSEYAYLEKMGRQGPYAATDNSSSKNDNNSDKKSGGSQSRSSSNSGASSAGSYTPPPLAELKNYVGPKVSCTDQALSTEMNKITAQINPDSSNLCQYFHDGLKIYYFTLTLLEKSCPNRTEMIEEQRNQVQIGLEGIQKTCN